mgnify:CR=1 FL=1
MAAPFIKAAESKKFKFSPKKGMNRFVWDMRYPTMPGIPTAYIEGSYRGHKVIPGTYSLTLKRGNATATSEVQILNNPLYDIDQATYQIYDVKMKEMEMAFTQMELLGFSLCSPFELLKEPPENNRCCKDLEKHLGRHIDIYGYLVTVKNTDTRPL